MDDRLLSPREFAKASGLHPETVREMCRRGDLPALKIGKRVWRLPASLLKDVAPKGRKVAA